nr:hypothetical protein [Zoogloea sp.]
MTGQRAQLHQDVAQAASQRGLRRRFRRHREAPGTGLQGRRHLFGGKHMGDIARLDGTGGHAVVFGAGGLLGQRHTARPENRAHTQRAIAAGARKNDSDRVFLLVFRQRTQEEIHRHAQPAGLGGRTQLQLPVKNRHVPIGRNDVHVIGLDLKLIHRLEHRHGGRALKEFGEQADMPGIEMRHQHEGHPAVCRAGPEEVFERLQPAGRRADTDNAQARDQILCNRFCRARHHCRG